MGVVLAMAWAIVLVGLALQMAGALAIERRGRTGLTPEPGGLPVKREKK